MIVLECNADEYLVKSLGFSKKQIAHEGCKGKVLKRVRIKGKAIGIIDEDPQSTQPHEMSEYKAKQTAGSIKLFQKKNDNKKKLIQVSPYLEAWLLQRAKRSKINPKEFNLPDDPKKLHAIPHLEKKRNFQEFLAKLINTDSEIQVLRKWLKNEME